MGIGVLVAMEAPHRPKGNLHLMEIFVRVDLPVDDRALVKGVYVLPAPGVLLPKGAGLLARLLGRRRGDLGVGAGPKGKDHRGKVPEEKGASQAIGRHMDGCRIGFDAGGSDRKVSAVVDGETVYSEEVVWFPKTNADPDYHYDGIVAAFKSAAEKMPRVDAVGVSSAGVYVDNRTMVASLFLKVPKDAFEAKVKDIYIRAIKDTFGDIPFAVANDGDVSALAGAMSLEDNSVLASPWPTTATCPPWPAP